MVKGVLANMADDLKRNKFLYILVAPAVVQFILFSYLPMFGIVIVFQDFSPAKGFLRSDWVGLRNFVNFFSSPMAFKVIRNSILLSFYGLLWTFPFPILFAILLNELRSKVFKRVVQTVSFLPHFLSNVIIVSIVMMLLSLDTGVVNIIIGKVFGGHQIYFMIDPRWFRTIYIATGLWQGMGWGAIIYLASIVSIDPELYEAAIIDGATRSQKIIRITIPMLKPTIVIMLILSIASIMNVGFEKIYLMGTPPTYDVSEVIETFTYRRGMGIDTGIPDYSFGAAVGFFQSIVNSILLLSANWFSGKFFDKRIF